MDELHPFWAHGTSLTRNISSNEPHGPPTPNFHVVVLDPSAPRREQRARATWCRSKLFRGLLIVSWEMEGWMDGYALGRGLHTVGRLAGTCAGFVVEMWTGLGGGLM